MCPGYGDVGEVAARRGAGPAVLREEDVEVFFVRDGIGVGHERILADIGGAGGIVGMRNGEDGSQVLPCDSFVSRFGNAGTE